MSSVNTALNSLTNSVDQLFRVVNETGFNPVADRFICFHCGRTNDVMNKIRRTKFNRPAVRKCDLRKCHKCRTRNQFPCCRYCKFNTRRPSPTRRPFPSRNNRNKRQAAVDSLVCPINDVLATAQTAQEVTQVCVCKNLLDH
ncbi:unnamed protein product, partial [Meganyctiphanes norvegica]